jgi:hypothetical protein
MAGHQSVGLLAGGVSYKILRNGHFPRPKSLKRYPLQQKERCAMSLAQRFFGKPFAQRFRVTRFSLFQFLSMDAKMAERWGIL